MAFVVNRSAALGVSRAVLLVFEFKDGGDGAQVLAQQREPFGEGGGEFRRSDEPQLLRPCGARALFEAREPEQRRREKTLHHLRADRDDGRGGGDSHAPAPQNYARPTPRLAS